MHVIHAVALRDRVVCYTYSHSSLYGESTPCALRCSPNSFEWDTTHLPAQAGASDEDALSILNRNVAEFGGDDTDKPFMEKLLQGVLAKKADIDLVIEKTAPDW